MLRHSKEFDVVLGLRGARISVDLYQGMAHSLSVASTLSSIKYLSVALQGLPGSAGQGGLPGLDAAGNGRSILWDPVDPLLGTPDMVRMIACDKDDADAH